MFIFDFLTQSQLVCTAVKDRIEYTVYVFRNRVYILKQNWLRVSCVSRQDFFFEHQKIRKTAESLVKSSKS